jgi:DNA-binding transcriptional regulator YhcF (GntR family)
MILRVDPDSPVAPYEQVRAQIATMVATGVLPPGTRLPAIRQLASDLRLAGGTIARAYRELEQQGFINTRGRHGTYVLDSRRPPGKREQKNRLEEAAHTFAVTALQLDVTSTQALEAVRTAFDAVSEDAANGGRGKT